MDRVNGVRLKRKILLDKIKKHTLHGPVIDRSKQVNKHLKDSINIRCERIA